MSTIEPGTNAPRLVRPGFLRRPFPGAKQFPAVHLVLLSVSSGPRNLAHHPAEA